MIANVSTEISNVPEQTAETHVPTNVHLIDQDIMDMPVPTPKKRGRKKGGKNKPNNDKNSTKIEDSGRLKKVQIQYLKNEFSEDSNKISNTRAEEIAIQISSNAQKVKRWWATNQKSGYKSKPNK